MKLKELELNKQYVTGDSYGYYLVEMVSEVRNNPQHGPNYIEANFKSVKNGIEATFGYNTEYPVYAPRFYTMEEWLKHYPPEYRDRMLEELE